MSNHEHRGMPSWVLQATLMVLGGILATLAAIWLLIRLQDLVMWLVVALFLSFAIEPLVNSLERRGWNRRLATALMIGGLVVAIFVFLGLMVPVVIKQVQDLIREAPQWVDQISNLINRWFGVNVTTADIIESIKRADISLGDTATSVASNVLDISGKIVSGIFQTFTVGFFTYYFVAEGPKFRRKVLTLMPAKQQRLILESWEVAMEKTGGYIYSRLLLGLISSFVTFIVLSAIGVPFAIPLALWVGFISQFVPVVGTFIAAAVPLLVALLESPVAALIFLIYVILYQQVENYLISPRITARTMQLHPAVAIGAVIAGASLRGPVGAILALPVAAILQALVGEYITRHDVIDDDSGLLDTKPTPRPTKKKAKAEL